MMKKNNGPEATNSDSALLASHSVYGNKSIEHTDFNSPYLQKKLYELKKKNQQLLENSKPDTTKLNQSFNI